MKSTFNRALAIVILGMLAPGMTLHAQTRTVDTLKQGLFLPDHISQIGPTDPIIERMIDGKEVRASEGRAVEFQNGKKEAWTSHTADSTGWFRGDYLNGAYGFFDVKSNIDRVALLESKGNDIVYINGVPRQGNKYAYKDTWQSWEPNYNYPEIPIRLRRGNNRLVFVCNRGVLKIELEYIRPGILFNTGHVTVPDFVVGEAPDDYAAVTVINATDKPLRGAYIKAYNDSGFSVETRVPIIQPMSLRKVAFKLVGPAPSDEGVVKIKLALYEGESTMSRELAHAEIPVKVVSHSATRNITFISSIDGSVQYYSLVPPRGPDNGKPKALFLSLHGADVIATNMANSYYPKTWGYIVCPTNGGPYGFDWEDWGRLDALQVLHIAESTLNVDPSRVYLTGHSMGGHGVWIIGAQYPDLFGAMGPSAGWISWWTYVFRHDTMISPMANMLERATMPVHTFGLDRNYKQLGIYMLQGSKDDNVPITESLTMVDSLSKFDKDYTFHEEMGVGHWWGLNDEAGSDCVDWPPMFDFFARHARPGLSRTLEIDFTTASPGVSAKDYWLTIYSQEKQLEFSNAKVSFIPSRNRFVGTTHNVKIISFDLEMADTSKPFNFDLDGTKLDDVKVPANETKVWLEKQSDRWMMVRKPSPDDKNPVRYGTFKDAFRHDMEFVYGTHGTKAENKWAFDKARFDAEYFWYQGNCSIEVVSDREFNPKADPNRSIILYGNEKTNSAWNEVLSNSPVTVSDGELNFGNRIMKGKDYACFMIRPRKGSNLASVGVVSGTGIEGMRLTYIVPYLQPWFSLPDLTILNTSVFKDSGRKSKVPGYYGHKNGGQLGFSVESGLKVAGFFGLDWSLKNGDFVEQK
jgi:hypothetical protein